MEDLNIQPPQTEILSLEERAKQIVDAPHFTSFGTLESDIMTEDFKRMYFEFIMMHFRAVQEEARSGR